MGLKAAMCQHAVIAHCDADRAEKIHPGQNSDIVPVDQALPEQPDRAERASERYDHAEHRDRLFESAFGHIPLLFGANEPLCVYVRRIPLSTGPALCPRHTESSP
jgi:hypothetical protein